jgi:ceramide glucosyltransferase
MVMTSLVAAAALAVLLGLHVVTVALAAWRCKARAAPMPAPPQAPPVTLIRPLCGLEHGLERTLRSSLQLDYPDYEVIFCVARTDDPAVPLVRRLMRAHPQARARLLIGDDMLCDNS